MKYLSTVRGLEDHNLYDQSSGLLLKSLRYFVKFDKGSRSEDLVQCQRA